MKKDNIEETLNLNNEEFLLKKGGMTEKEREISTNLVNAWNAFLELGDKHPCDNKEFGTAIRECQKLLALRIVRRDYPEHWVLPKNN